MLFESLSILCVCNNSRISFYTLILAFRFLHRSHFVLPIIKQRLLIARAVYKNPEFLFFDEATNALDANNEKEIMEHLHEFYKGKTVVVVAHRLSTVKDADKIVVLDKGCIVEEGTHRELTERKGLYYRLVKNQLELGS